MYGQIPPMVNASRQPGEWQSYDIAFTGPRFNGTTLEKPAIVTVLHNGVVVHAPTAFWGPTAHKLIGPTSRRTRRATSACRITAIPSGSGISGSGRSRMSIKADRRDCGGPARA